VTGSVSGKTDILVAGAGAGSKKAVAEGHGVEIWSEADFMASVKGSAKGGTEPKKKTEVPPKAVKKTKRAPPKTSGSIASKILCFTGTLEMKRTDAKKLAEANGAKVSAAMSGKTDILVAGEDAGSKIAAAEDKGVEVWTEVQFMAAVGADGGADTDEEPEPPKKKAKATAKKPPPKAASKKHADGGALGEIDLEVQRVGSAEGILSTEVAVFSDAEYCYDAKLALVEPSINSDKYYILQIVKDGDDFVVPPPSYFVCCHWGRTGTAGQTKLDPVASEEAAVQQFEKVFKSKTGISWREQDPGADPKKGKYRHLAVSTAGRGKGGTGKWQYYLNHDPHGKRDGWYDYDPENSEQVELLHQDHASNPSMTCRFIHSDTSGFTYKVDLENGTQTNVTSGKERPIKRIKSK